MFDIGFAELLIIAVVSLLVIGPERLPGAVRTASAWLSRFRRSFNEIKQEVQQELHNDQVMRELRESGEKLRRETDALREDLSDINPAADLISPPDSRAPVAGRSSGNGAPDGNTPETPAASPDPGTIASGESGESGERADSSGDAAAVNSGPEDRSLP